MARLRFWGWLTVTYNLEADIKPSQPLSAELGISFSDGGGGINYIIGDGLKLEGRTLSVDTAKEVEQDNTKPVTSAAVYVQLGNVEALLKSI